MLPHWWRIESFGHQIRDLLLGVAVAHADFGRAADLEEPGDINPVSARQVAEGSGSTFSYDLDHCFIVFCHYQVGDVVTWSRVGVVAPRVEVDVVAIVAEYRLTNCGC